MPDTPDSTPLDADDAVPGEKADRDRQERERTGNCAEQDDALDNNTLALP